MGYSKLVISNSLEKSLSEGYSTNEALNRYLMMKMSGSITQSRIRITKAPTLSDINMHLLGNRVIDDKDFGIKTFVAGRFTKQRLEVKLTSFCTLCIESTQNALYANVNSDNATVTCIRNRTAEEVALWIISQKPKIDNYMEEWGSVINNVSKKVKGINLSKLAIKAIVGEAMKEFPMVKYELVEQRRRTRVNVRLPNSRLGVHIDAWFGSYEQQLPQQLESLKLLIEAHMKAKLNDFFLIKR